MQDENVKAKIEGKIREEDLNEVIDSTLFVQCLALCSLEIYFSEPQPNVLEKVKFFWLIKYRKNFKLKDMLLLRIDKLFRWKKKSSKRIRTY